MFQVERQSPTFGPPEKLSATIASRLRDFCITTAEKQVFSKVTPSDVSLTKFLRELHAANPLVPSLNGERRVRFRSIASLNIERRGMSAHAIDPKRKALLYHYALLKLGVHSGAGTAFPEHLSALGSINSGNVPAGGNTTANSIFYAKCLYSLKGDSSFNCVKLRAGKDEFHLTVAGPEYFVGAIGKKNIPVPDVFLGQTIKNDGSPSPSAVQLSKEAQDFIAYFRELHWRHRESLEVSAIDLPDPQIAKLCEKGKEMVSWCSSIV